MRSAMPVTSEPASPPRGAPRRDRIVEAALVVIANVGPDALTHRRVASAAGVPVAATTYWFSSKEELVRAAFDRAVDRDLERLTERAVSALTWTRATVARELARTLHANLADRTTALVDGSLWLEAVRRPELRAVAERWEDAYVAFYAGVLQRIDPAITDVDVRLITATIEGLMMQELTRERPHSERVLAQWLERLLSAFIDAAQA